MKKGYGFLIIATVKREAPDFDNYLKEINKMAEVTVTKDNFKAEVLESDIPVLVDFWASWCGPCKMLAPILEEVGREKEGSLKIAKINVDDEPELANQFGINSIPSVFLFRNGQVANRAVGLMPKAKVLEFIG